MDGSQETAYSMMVIAALSNNMLKLYDLSAYIETLDS